MFLFVDGSTYSLNSPFRKDLKAYISIFTCFHPEEKAYKQINIQTDKHPSSLADLYVCMGQVAKHIHHLRHKEGKTVPKVGSQQITLNISYQNSGYIYIVLPIGKLLPKSKMYIWFHLTRVLLPSDLFHGRAYRICEKVPSRSNQ